MLLSFRDFLFLARLVFHLASRRLYGRQLPSSLTVVAFAQLGEAAFPREFFPDCEQLLSLYRYLLHGLPC